MVLAPAVLVTLLLTFVIGHAVEMADFLSLPFYLRPWKISSTEPPAIAIITGTIRIEPTVNMIKNFLSQMVRCLFSLVQIENTANIKAVQSSIF